MPTDEGFGDLGSLGGGIGGFEEDSRQLIDRMLGDDVLDTPPGAARAQVQPPDPIPVNKATMTCLRGPCAHYWTMVTPSHVLNKKVQPMVTRVCVFYKGEETSLAEQNIFDCGAWWPAALVWVPESLRPALRPKLKRAWELWLKFGGYNFDWKWWAEDAFELDRPEEREVATTGVGPASVRKNAEPNGHNALDAGVVAAGRWVRSLFGRSKNGHNRTADVSAGVGASMPEGS